EELVEQPFARIAEKKQLWTFKYDGFWMAMDTLKDKIVLDRMDSASHRPWNNRTHEDSETDHD
ncbi:MAG: glucose-1-phosphate cytidylyltransferase, partial [Gammaproteobacteria bacterium]